MGSVPGKQELLPSNDCSCAAALWMGLRFWKATTFLPDGRVARTWSAARLPSHPALRDAPAPMLGVIENRDRGHCQRGLSQKGSPQSLIRTTKGRAWAIAVRRGLYK